MQKSFLISLPSTMVQANESTSLDNEAHVSPEFSISAHLSILLVLSVFLNRFKWLTTIGLIMPESRNSFWNLGICQEQNRFGVKIPSQLG